MLCMNWDIHCLKKQRKKKNNMFPIEPVSESEPFEFTHDAQKYKAIVRYYSDASCDVELDSIDAKANDKAWQVAELLDLIE